MDKHPVDPGPEQPGEGPSNEKETIREIRDNRKRITFLNGIVVAMAALYLGTASVVAGDVADPFAFGRERATYVQQDQGQQFHAVLKNSTEHRAVLTAQSNSDSRPDTPTSTCDREIRSDLAPEPAREIQYLEDANEGIPNVHAEHYLATTRDWTVTYLCTITIVPYDVKVMRTGLATLPPRPAPPR